MGKTAKPLLLTMYTIQKNTMKSAVLGPVLHYFTLTYVIIKLSPNS